ncbi:MAG: PEP-CTERM sorting domain-containing protein [Gammaproteobacteria bacterium]|nr:PEP-CTERM sorting domain-containing protein [Gammaproteobacteria bacterium]
MKKFIAIMALILGFSANASLLTIDVQSNEVNVGDSLTVTINAQNFVDTDIFWVDFAFDTSVFSFDSASLTTDLTLFDGVDPFYGLEFESQSDGISFNFLTDLFTPVTGDFVLASFDLIAMAVGVSDFGATGSDYAVDYSASYVGTSLTQVNAAVSVPEPSIALMMLVAGFALVRVNRKS